MTAAIVLAAGASTRLGQPKQLVRLAGERLLERAVRVAREAGCDPVLVVLGANAGEIARACDLGGAQAVVNDAWADGMASSLRLGIETVGDAERAIVMTCDQPAVTPEHLRRLIERCLDAPVASSYAGRRGVPACFPATTFAELLRLHGDAGARHLLESAVTVELIGGGLDIDTAEALELAKRIYE
jgi:CTP:molybdopterin cytidylyltransferase MocA